MNAPDLVADIARRAAQLSPDLQAEVLDFVEFIGQRRRRTPETSHWIRAVWGSAPGFPDRVPQPPLADAPTWQLVRLLDTNLCIEVLRSRNEALRQRLAQTNLAEICLCSVVWGELYTGANLSSDPQKSMRQLGAFRI